MTPTMTTRAPVTIRLEYSMNGWMLIDPVTLPLKHVGQSGQPRPEPVRRTAAPVRTMRIMETERRQGEPAKHWTRDAALCRKLHLAQPR